jgi:hypothetical protein
MDANKRLVTIRTAPSLKVRLEHRALDEGVPMTQIIVRLIEEEMKREEILSADMPQITPHGERMTERIAFMICTGLYKTFQHRCINLRAKPQRIINWLIYEYLNKNEREEEMG